MVNWGPTFYMAFKEDTPPSEEVEKIPISCPHCGVHTDAKILERHITEKNDFIKLPMSEMSLYSFFLRCTRCKGPILLLWTYGTDHRNNYTAGKIVYPLRNKAFEIDRFGEEAIPEAVLEDLKQAELAYYAKAYYGAGLLLRSACQNICRDKKAVGQNLKSEIKDLAKKNIVTKELAETAHTIRIVANEIAHPNPQKAFIITWKDIKACREFLRQLIESIYIGPYRNRMLRKDLKKRGIKDK